MDLVEQLERRGFQSGLAAIREATKEELKEEDAIGFLIQRLSTALPDEKTLNEKNEEAAGASIALLAHLWKTQGKAAELVALGIPLLAADSTAHLPGRKRVMAPPVAAWPETARRFAFAYVPSRVLSDRYLSPDELLLKALETWGIAHPGLLVMTSREELTERGLRPIALNPEEIAGATLRNERMMQIALLEWRGRA